MDNRGSWSSCAFELEDIEIINHKTDRNEEKLEKWNCDQCSLFFLEKGKLDEHKKKHSHQDIVKCKYCNKDISSSSENRECYLNKKCETCEYKCTKCPKRFLRHSSLMNHEKKHTSPKTKRINRNKKVNGVATDNTPKALKRNHIDADDLEKQTKELKLPKSVNEGNSPKKEGFETQDDNKSTPSKISRRLSFKGSKSAERKNNCGVKSSKQPMSKNNSILEETCSDSKSNQSTIPCNSQTASSTINVLTNENVVNYKPFSCHVCGDTFASDNALLTHIRTHGENAIKSFKCKFCGDEFDDIYKMQYHLAICPLAEDELEFKQVIPTNIPTKYSGGISTPRKRGRPKKIREVNSNEEESNNESIPQLSSKRGNVKRRKEEDTENIPNEIVQNSLAPPNQSNDSPEKEQLSGPNTIGVDEDDIDLMSGDITEIRDYEPSDDRKKIHLCPFPQCDFKFTREKALLCHMRNHSDDFDDSLKCHKCDIPFDDIHALRQHINSCKGIKEEKDDDFSRADLYDSSPNRTLHRPKRDYFVCNQCGKSYQNQEKLNRHLESCGSKFVCRICKDDFLNQPLLDEHFGSKHPPNTAYHCYICEEDFISELFLQIHQSDEHGQNLDSSPTQDVVRETTPQVLPTKIQVPYNDINTMKVNEPCTENNEPCRFSNRIPVGPIGTKIGRNGRFFWCPVCLVGFDTREYMRIHFREEHVVEKNSTYSCGICEVKMPFAEMMCYHLELHSNNLLSVNRFSKLLAYVKQNRFDELRSSKVKAKFQEISKNKTSSDVIEIIDIDNDIMEKLPEGVQTVSTTNKSSPLQNQKIKPKINLMGHKKCDDVVELLKGGKSNQNEKNGRKNSAENSSTTYSSNGRIRNINKSEIELGNPSRPLRSRTRVNYAPNNKAEEVVFRPKASVSNNSCEETNSLQEKCDIVVDDSVADKQRDSAEEKIQAIKGAQKRQTLSLRAKKQDTLTCVRTDPNASPHSITETINPDVLENDKLVLVNDEKELSIDEKDQNPITTVDKNTNTPQAKQTSLSNRDNKHLNSKIDSGGVQMKESNINDTENNEAELFLPQDNKNGIKEVLSAERKNVDINSDFNLKMKEISIKLANKSSKENNTDVKGGPLSEVSEISNETGTNKNVHSEDSVDVSMSKATNKLVEEKLGNENLLPCNSEVVNEKPMSSPLNSNEGSEGICCKMCTERFYNQDELLDHLASHI